jgi:hypothetical protein
MSGLVTPDSLPTLWEPLANHPVDLPLDTLKGAIAYVVGEPVELGIPLGKNHGYDKDATGAVYGGASILAYGAKGSEDVYEFPFQDKKLKKLAPGWAQQHLEHRDEYAGVDRREISRIMVTDGEVKPLGDFARDALLRVFNIPVDGIMASGINLGSVSQSQAGRILDVVRNQYADGNWRQTLQLALAASHIGYFIRTARETSYYDKTNGVVTIADDHIGDELLADYRTDTDLLIARSLKRGAHELRGDGRQHAADHVEAWLSMHEEGLTLDSFPPEVTIDDILTHPSYLNPRPDKGIPVLSNNEQLVGSTSSRNYTIKYPDGSVYAVDFPDHGYGPRPITGKQDVGYRGNVNDGTARNFVHVNEGWVDLIPTVEDHVSRKLVDEAMRRSVDLKEQTAEYGDVLRKASTFVDAYGLDPDQIAGVKNQLAAVLVAARCIEYTETTVGNATSLFRFSLRGVKRDVEEETGIRLTFGDGLSEETLQAYKEFGEALYGYELGRLAEAFTGHPEFAAHIAHNRKRRELTESTGYYYQQMAQAVQRLMGEGEVAELANREKHRYGFTESLPR